SWIISILDGSGNAVAEFAPAYLSVGGPNESGHLDIAGEYWIELDAESGSGSIHGSGGRALTWHANAGNGTARLLVGGQESDGGERPGWIAIRDQEGKDSIYLDGGDGLLSIRDAAGNEAFSLSQDAVEGTAGLMVGTYESDGGKRPGWIAIRDQE